MITASISAGLSVLLTWIPTAGMIVLIPAFLIRRHRYRVEQQRLEQIINAYESVLGDQAHKEENMPAK